MTQTMGKIALAIGLAALLGGCSSQTAPDATASQSSAQTTSWTSNANNFPTASGIYLSPARLVLPAVPGNPAALYFAFHNSRDTALDISKVDVMGAKSTEIHQTIGGLMEKQNTIHVLSGGTVRFVPGSLHVMVMGLAPTTKPGDVVSFSAFTNDGGLVTGDAKAEAPGGTADPATNMPAGMKM